MPMLRSRFVLLGAVASLPLMTAVAHADCNWYAQTALKQQQQNEQLKCGFVGPAWTSDMKAHLAWCGGVAPDKMKSEAQARDKQLQTCATTAKSNPFFPP